MITENAIDTNSLLTILGLAAAIWAIIPDNNRLRFRLSITLFDGLVIFTLFCLVHYLSFEKVFRALGYYYTLGPWLWGFDTNSSVYMLLLLLALYLLFRSRSLKLANRNVGIFEELFDHLLRTKRYDELASLVHPQLPKLIEISNHRPLLTKIAAKLKPQPVLDINALLRGEASKQDTKLKRFLRNILTRVESASNKINKSSIHAQNILEDISNSPELIAYLAVAHPYFCLHLLKHPDCLREDFFEMFMAALLSDRSSRIYIELKNNENLNGRHRLYLPEKNRIINFLFKDISYAERLGVYRGIGESVCMTLEEDKSIAELYNQALGYYSEVGKYRCPIYAGIKLFEIMIHEGIHQGIQDHLWLFYFTHFTEKILKQMRDYANDDEYHEHPTAFYYLLYQIVAITSNWVEDGLEVTLADIPERERNEPGFDQFYISKQACNALGTIIKDILESPKLSKSFKEYTLEIALRRYQKVRNNPLSREVADILERSIIEGDFMPTSNQYRRQLLSVFNSLDHVLIGKLPQFQERLEQAAKGDSLE